MQISFGVFDDLGCAEKSMLSHGFIESHPRRRSAPKISEQIGPIRVVKGGFAAANAMQQLSPIAACNASLIRALISQSCDS